jgi:hypothetical protein
MPLGSALCRELLIFEIWRFDEFDDRIAEKIGIFTVVEPETHFIEAGRGMLWADFMPPAHQSAFEQR